MYTRIRGLNSTLYTYYIPYMHVHEHICVYTHVYNVDIFTNIYIYIHTHIHTLWGAREPPAQKEKNTSKNTCAEAHARHGDPGAGYQLRGEADSGNQAVRGQGFRVLGFGFRVQGSGFGA